MKSECVLFSYSQGVLTLTYMSLIVGGNWSTWQKPSQTQGEYSNFLFTQKVIIKL